MRSRGGGAPSAATGNARRAAGEELPSGGAMKAEHLFGKRVFSLRKARGLSQKQLGEVLGLSNHAVSMMETGERGTTLEKLVLLAEYFQVSADYLLGITDDPAWRGEPFE